MSEVWHNSFETHKWGQAETRTLLLLCKYPTDIPKHSWHFEDNSGFSSNKTYQYTYRIPIRWPLDPPRLRQRMLLAPQGWATSPGSETRSATRLHPDIPTCSLRRRSLHIHLRVRSTRRGLRYRHRSMGWVKATGSVKETVSASR